MQRTVDHPGEDCGCEEEDVSMVTVAFFQKVLDRSDCTLNKPIGLGIVRAAVDMLKVPCVCKILAHKLSSVYQSLEYEEYHVLKHLFSTLQ